MKYAAEQRYYPLREAGEAFPDPYPPQLRWVVVNYEAGSDGKIWDAPYDSREEAQEVVDSYSATDQQEAVIGELSAPDFGSDGKTYTITECHKKPSAEP